MISLPSLFILIIAATGSLAAMKSTRIVGGRFAGDGQFPYQAAIMSPSGSVFCGGSILNDRFILTAGHCVEREVVFLKVMVGSTTITPPGPTYKVKAKYIHPDYIKNKVDLALLELEEPLKFSYTIAPIDIFDGKVDEGEEIIISGWGGTGERGSNRLKYAKVQIGDSTEVCPKNSDSIFALDYVLCLSHNVGTGFCSSDTGGPAVYNGKLIGEGIFVNGKCGSKPDGYQKLSYFRDWINKVAFDD